MFYRATFGWQETPSVDRSDMRVDSRDTGIIRARGRPVLHARTLPVSPGLPGQPNSPNQWAENRLDQVRWMRPFGWNIAAELHRPIRCRVVRKPLWVCLPMGPALG